MLNGMLIIGVLYGAVFMAGELLYHLGTDSNITRKIIHIGSGVVSALLPFFVSYKITLFLAVFFILFIFLSERYKYFHSIHNINWPSHGALLFPISLLLVALFFWESHPLAFSGSMLILGVSDGLASLIGRKWGKRSYYVVAEKTYEGSLVFFISTLVIFTGILAVQGIEGAVPFLIIALTSVFLTLVEGMSKRGWDNLFLPIITAVFLAFIL